MKGLIIGIVNGNEKSNNAQPVLKPKEPWTTPLIVEFSMTLIKQQEEEALYQLLSNEEYFKILTGSTPG